MNKFYGKVGYVETIEIRPGYWDEVATERNYYGDVLKNTKMWQAGTSANDDLNVSNQISIVADPYAHDHFHAIRYVEFMKSLWKVTSVDASQSPRLILSIGGVYNGPKVTTS